MNILVTGGAGYIGSHFSKRAYEAGHKVVVLDNLSMGHKNFVQFGSFVEADIRETEKVHKALKEYQTESIVHFAAKALVGESMIHPELYYDNNVKGTESILEAMKGTSVQSFVFSSSCATYGMTEEEKIAESHPQAPINPYGESKLECEEILLKAQKGQGFNLAMLRYFNVIGRDPDGKVWEDHTPETHLVPNLVKALETQKEFSIFGTEHPTLDGTCIRDYVDVNDLAAVHLDALEKNQDAKTLISNVGLGKGYSVKEVLNGFQSIFGRNLNVKEAPAREGDPPRLVADSTFFNSWSSVKLRSLEESLVNMKKFF